MPELSGVDGGVMRRVLVMPWDVRFYKADTEADLVAELREQGSEPKIARDRDELLTELKSQREGFFAALVRAHFEENRDGLGLPERVLEATREWAAAEDAVGTFLGLRTERAGDESYIVKDDLVREFNEWAHEIGASAMDSTGLTVALKGLGYKDARRRNAVGERERRFVGIAWKELS
jgi:putative DNA primase/helicase